MKHPRRYAMDGLKLLFMLLVVIHHSGFLGETMHHAYMAVDIFFMISGYLLCQTCMNDAELSVAGYFFRRLRKLYPHYFLSFVVMLLATSVYRMGGLSREVLLRAIPEMLLVQNLGFFDGGVNYPCWYLSVLVFASPLIWVLRRRLRVGWFNGIAVACIFASYGYILHSTVGSMETFATAGVFYLPFWRGVAGLLCGMLLYQLHRKLHLHSIHLLQTMQILELFALALSVGLMFHPGQVDGVILIGLVVLLSCSGNPKSVIERVSNCAAVRWGIRYEYAVFLNHAFVIGMVRKILGDFLGCSAPIQFSAMMILTVAYSIATEQFVNMVLSLFGNRKKVSV